VTVQDEENMTMAIAQLRAELKASRTTHDRLVTAARALHGALNDSNPAAKGLVARWDAVIQASAVLGFVLEDEKQ
jgi:hypothetical protein